MSAGTGGEIRVVHPVSVSKLAVETLIRESQPDE